MSASLAVAASLLLIASGAWLALDLDSDGVATFREFQYHTSPTRTDTDSDGLGDGWELLNFTNPLAADTDGDGLLDKLEVLHGAEPRDSDTDHDGLGDLREVQAGMSPISNDSDKDGIADGSEADADCNHDNVIAALQLDDDADGRPDAQETPAQRCEADFDSDGVLDGQEQNVACVSVVDCDGDGLPDGVEYGTRFSPLAGDTLGSGLSDAVAKGFTDVGALPSSDDDHDGIPDLWESDIPPVPWGALQPKAGQKDLLVEFLRLQGPDSRNIVGGKSFSPAYDAMAAMFLNERGIKVTWTETIVEMTADPLGPHGLNPNDTYYQHAFAKSKFANHPYVNIIVLAPHLGQAIPHSGIGQVRGMFAAIDYSQFVTARFEDSKGRSFTTSPGVEADPNNWISITGDNRPIIKLWDISIGATGYVPIWEGYWFHTMPVLQDSKAAISPTSLQAVTVYQVALASTIAHELGHNLGLCHSHEPSCYANFTAVDQAARDTSTMSYNSHYETLHLLPSEWATVSEYLTCPPTATLELLAEQVPAIEVWDAKFVQVEERTCGTFQTLSANLEFTQSPAQSYQLSDHERPVPVLVLRDLTPAFAALAALAMVGSALACAWWLRPPRAE